MPDLGKMENIIWHSRVRTAESNQLLNRANPGFVYLETTNYPKRKRISRYGQIMTKKLTLHAKRNEAYRLD